MRRRLITIAIFLFAGALTNVAVAWACAIWVGCTLESLVEKEASGNEFWAGGTVGRPGARLIWSIRDRVTQPDRRREPVTGFIPNWCASISDPTPLYFEGQSQIEFRLANGRGWPLLTLWSEHRYYSENSPSPDSVMVLGGIDTGLELPDEVTITWLSDHAQLPLRPIWLGFAVNTILYGAALWLVATLPFVVRRFVRLRGGLCPGCAYPRGEALVCPECGTRLPKRAVA